MVALSGTHALAARDGPLRLADLADLPLIVYPKAPRPSFADQVLALFRDRNLRPPLVHEVKELQTPLGLVAAESGISVVPASVERLRRDNVFYVSLNEPDAISPIIMSNRRDDPSPETALILNLIKQMYRDEGIAFGRRFPRCRSLLPTFRIQWSDSATAAGTRYWAGGTLN